MKYLPSLITLSRCVSSLALLTIHTFSPIFFIIYTYCGVSDILDGFLARRLHCENEKGARLDSISDIVFYGAAAIKIMPALCNTLTPLIWFIIAAAAVLRLIAYITAAIKYRRFASLHTYMNKLTGFLVFTVPYIIFQSFARTACMLISLVAVSAAAEELVIHICAPKYYPDRKSLFIKRREK